MPTDQRSGANRRYRVPEHDRLRSIVERMADGILVVSLDGSICFANPAAERLFARSAAELTGEYLGFPSVAGESAEIDVVRPNGETVSVELRIVDTDWENQAARLASLRDITDRRRAADQAAQLERERIARAEAEAASQAKSEFLAMMSHELRTPLTAIIGYAELLDLHVAGPLAAEQHQQLGRIDQCAHHLLELVNEVLDLSKCENGRLILARGSASAARTIDAALAIVEPTAESHGISMSAHDDCAHTTYAGDENRVRQILVSLLMNAVTFTPAGRSVSVECGRADRPDATASVTHGAREWIYMRVRDDGIGIPVDQLDRIFDPFVQVSGGHTRKSDGAGLGLPVSRELARLMSGDITVESELHKGSAFTLWLPASATADDEPAFSLEGRGSRESSVTGLDEIGIAMEQGLKELLDAFVARLRTEHVSPGVDSLGDSQLANHLGAYVATIASVLIAVQDARGKPTSLVADATEILRTVAERHGTQRARLGWTREALQHEWRLLADECQKLIQRHASASAVPAMDNAKVMVIRFLEHGEVASLRALTRSLPNAPSPAVELRRTRPDR